MAVSELLADRVRTLLATESGLSERKMFGGLCFMIDGNMACGITGQNDLMLRVGADAYESFLGEPGARPMDFTGLPMKGMIFVDPDSCQDEEAMAAWLEKALAFARSLPPK